MPEDQIMWKVVSSRLVFSSRFLRVFEDKLLLPNGEFIYYSRLDMPDFVTVLPLTSEGEVIMIRNYRYPANGWFVELPSGHLEECETPEQCAERELKEESGYDAECLKYVTWYHPTSRSCQKAHIFIATSLRKGKHDRDKTEHQQVLHLSTQEVFKMLDQGLLKHAPTIIALAICRKHFFCDEAKGTPGIKDDE